MSEWNIEKLGDVAVTIQPGPFGSQLHRADYSETGIPIIMPKDMIGGHIDHTNLSFVSEEHAKRLSRHQVHTGDLMVARKGDVRKCVYISKNENGWMTGSDCLKVSLDNSKCVSRFIYYQLRTPFIGKWLETISIGSTMPSINSDLLSSIEIHLPTIEIQQKITKILKYYDDLIENNNRQIKLLEEAAQRLYKEWFVDLHFPGCEDCKIVDGVPEGWKIENLIDFADVVMGQSPKSEFYNREKHGLPFHQGVGTYGNRFVVDNLYSTSGNRIAEANSILFSVRAPVGRLNITKNKIMIGRGLAAINQKKSKQSFLFYALKTKFFRDDIIGNGSIFSSITKDDLFRQKLLIPSDEMLNHFEEVAAPIDKMIRTLDNEVVGLIEARDRLLPKLMSGEIEV
jgi:type I restriction enzyme S subunit